MIALDFSLAFQFSRNHSEFAKTYETRFCVHSRSRCTSFAVLMPSAKSVLRPAILLAASCCSSMSCRVLALSSPDLVNCSARIAEEKRCFLRLRLLRKAPVHWGWIVRALDSIAHVIEQIDAGGAANRRVVLAGAAGVACGIAPGIAPRWVVRRPGRCAAFCLWRRNRHATVCGLMGIWVVPWLPWHGHGSRSLRVRLVVLRRAVVLRHGG